MCFQDIKTGQKLLEEDFIKSNPEFVKELEIMLASKEKAEIQVQHLVMHLVQWQPKITRLDCVFARPAITT